MFCAQLKCQLDAYLSTSVSQSGRRTVGGSEDIVGHLRLTGEKWGLLVVGLGWGGWL